jgi:hypothetical protein
MSFARAESGVVLPFVGGRVICNETARFEHPLAIVGSGKLALMACLRIETTGEDYAKLYVLRTHILTTRVPRIYVADALAYDLIKQDYSLYSIRGSAGPDSLAQNSDDCPISIGKRGYHSKILSGSASRAADWHVSVAADPNSETAVFITDTSNYGTIVEANWNGAFAGVPPSEQETYTDNVAELSFGN